MSLPFNRRLWFAVVGIMALIAASPASAGTRDQPGSVADVEFLGEIIVPTGTMFDETEIGGLSSITYDRARGVYHVLSDDQGNRTDAQGQSLDDPVRFYTLKLNLDDGTADADDLRFIGVTQLFDRRKEPFAAGGVDPEGFVVKGGSFFLSSEGNALADPPIEPFIRRYNRRGIATAHFPIPDKYIPNGVDHGVRFNLAFESLNLTPDRRTLVTAAEGALYQDGPASSFENGSLARLLLYRLNHRTPSAEYVYEVEPWAEPSSIFGVNGIVEVLPIDDVGTMLVLERSFSVGGVLGGGTGNVVKLYEISTDGATDVLAIDALGDPGSPVAYTPVSKRLLFEFDDLGVPIDNIEGMTFGPRLPDGRRTLVLVSDNNFSAAQFTQFIVLATDIR